MIKTEKQNHFQIFLTNIIIEFCTIFSRDTVQYIIDFCITITIFYKKNVRFSEYKTHILLLFQTR